MVPPPGYVAQDPPEEKTWSFAGARLTQKSTRKEDGSVVVMHSFDTGPPEMTAAELAKFRKDLKAFMDSDVIRVRFVHEVASLIDAGKIKQALAAVRALIAKHPEQPGPQARLADALVAAGLGAAAREVIDRALVKFPDSAQLHRTKGWILEHDLLGRAHARGFDRDGALASYRKAKDLDASDWRAWGGLALLLERDGDGRRWFPPQGHAEALVAHEKIEAMEVTALQANHAIMLLKAGRWDRAITLARKLDTVETLPVRLAALGATKSPSAAVAEVQGTTLSASVKAEQLRAAAIEVANLRRYPEAVRLLQEAAKTHERAAALNLVANLLRRIRPHEELLAERSTPKAVARAFAMTVQDTRRGTVDESLRALLSPSLPAAYVPAIPEAARGLQGAAQWIFQGNDELPPAVRKDLVGTADPSVEGNDRDGYEVSFTGWSVFVDREGGRYVVAGTSGDGAVRADMAARRLARKDIESAARWLDAELEASSGDEQGESDPLSGHPLSLVWHEGGPRDALAVTSAVAVSRVAAGKYKTADIEKHLRACMAKAWSVGARTGCEKALFDWHMANGAAREALDVSVTWLNRHLESGVARVRHASALAKLGRGTEVKTLLKRPLASEVHKAMAARSLAELAVLEGRLAESIQTLEPVLGDRHAIHLDYNNMAWWKWTLGQDLERAEELARTAVEMTKRTRYPELHTLACIVASRGRAEEALDLFKEARDRRHDDFVAPDWLLTGLIAEALDMPVTARAMYQKIEGPDAPGADSSFAIAQSRLTKLNKIVAGPPAQRAP